MKLRVLNSGSDGNGYLLECGNEVLILECGVPLMEAKIALNFDLSKVVGVFVSHGHLDHSKYRKDYELLGVDVIAPYDKDLIRQNAQCGGFNIQAFRMPHGETFSYGALIRHTTGETILFQTDCECNEYVFKACKVNHFIVECNFQPQYVDLGVGNKSFKFGHCSLDTLKRFMKVNETEYTKSVLLVHLGQGSTNPKECVEEIKNVLSGDVVVDYARRNTTYNF